MKVNEVMKETGLTKKAIYYYESEGLVTPMKDPENNYRNYTEEDIKRLIIINILRRLDIPIKAIAKIIKNSVPIKDVLKENLIITNQKINLLILNKMIMNDLITKDVKEKDFSFDTLKEINLGMGKKTAGSSSVGEDLEQIFPGTLGKTFTIYYGSCFNVPLNTDERISAWSELVRRIDETDEIDFPEHIQKTVDEIYTKVGMEKLIPLEGSTSQMDILKEKKTLDDLLDVTMAREEPDGYYLDPEEQRKAVGYYQLQSFILDHLDLFGAIENYINLINGKQGDGKTPAP